MTRTIAMTAEELRRKTIIEQAEEKRITQKEGQKSWESVNGIFEVCYHGIGNRGMQDWYPDIAGNRATIVCQDRNGRQ